MTILSQYIVMNSIALPGFSLSDSASTNSSSIWTSGAIMTVPRSDFTGSALNEKIYVIGGFNNKGQTIDSVEYYDPKTNMWRTATSLPEILNHPAAAAFNGSLYVVGGFDWNKRPSDKLYIYNPLTDKWHEGKSMPKARGALSANFINGTLYAVGGVDESGVSGSNTAYDVATNQWTEKAPMPTAREHLASAVVKGKLYVVGGTVGGNDHNLNVSEVYNPINDTWTGIEPMPLKRGGLAAASANGNIYVFGGDEPGGTFDNNEKYDPHTNKWTEEPSMPTARHGLTAATVNENIYVVGGGLEPGLSVTGVNEIFHPTNISMSSNSNNLSVVNRTAIDLVKDPFFRLIGKDVNLTSYWKDPHNSCLSLFTCNSNLTDGWADNQSYQLSTTNGTENTWSWIAPSKIDVKPNQQYELVTHMKLNQWATQSHILLRGFNESSQKWYQIVQCPSGINGPLEWKEFDCKIIIPQNTTKIKPMLNAGWSSREGEKAVTSFDAVHLYRIN
jgi:N-acetylneuraminic acid mutarotase